MGAVRAWGFCPIVQFEFSLGRFSVKFRGGSGRPYPDIISCVSASQWQSHRLAQAEKATDPGIK
jgi:hypothetical protein